MDRPALTVADVVRRYGDLYRDHAGPSLPVAHRRVLTAITACRTAALGGHVEQCDDCRYRRIGYNSCRNRHCPTCQSLARARWIETRTADLLDTGYVHVVVTVPQPVAEIALQNKAVVYGILFRATAKTLRTIATDPKHLGAEIGFFAVLHTWGQTLVHHLACAVVRHTRVDSLIQFRCAGGLLGWRAARRHAHTVSPGQAWRCVHAHRRAVLHHPRCASPVQTVKGIAPSYCGRGARQRIKVVPARSQRRSRT